MAYARGSSFSETAVRCYVFIAALLLIGIVCGPYVQSPPVWDAASGVFAPAVYLYEKQGGLVELLQEPGFVLGGPNIHSMSLYTGLVYWSMCIFDGKPDYFLAFLHIITILAASLLALTLFSTLRLGYSREKSFFGALVLISYPLFLVQASYVYTEIPGSMFALLSSYFWVKKKYLGASIMVFTALLVKALGLFCVAALLALMLIDSIFSDGGRRGLKYFLFVLLSSFAVMLVRWHFGTTPQGRITYLEYIQSVFSYLSNVPDLFIFILIVPGALVVLLLQRHSLGVLNYLKKILSSPRQRLILASLVYSFAFIALVLTISLSGKNFFPLPRYYVWVLPSFLVCFVYVLDLLLNKYFHSMSRVLFALSIVFIVFVFSSNRSGVLYPYGNKRISSFSVVERSFEYTNFWNAQRSAVQYVDKEYNSFPVFVTRGEYYYMSSPLMGYVKNEMENLNFVLAGSKEVSLPPEFIIIDAGSNAYHGQGVIAAILKVVSARSDLSLKLVHAAEYGHYYSRVFLVESVTESKGDYTNNSSKTL